jgi:hypothetical protein
MTVIKVLSSDNELKYTNKIFKKYLSAQEIHYETTYSYTLAQNGVKEKNKHILEVARNMMISMNVPK